jgi:predicted regulator of Ras-like GTPase activity (Roadblock/LC7/MglB family)
MAGLSQSAEELNWLVTDLVTRIPGADAAVVVSTDGFAITYSESLDRERAEKIAALGSGLYSLARGSGELADLGAFGQAMIRYSDGWLIQSVISTTSLLTLCAKPRCDMRVAGSEMARLAHRAAVVLTPDVYRELTHKIGPVS